MVFVDIKFKGIKRYVLIAEPVLWGTERVQQGMWFNNIRAELPQNTPEACFYKQNPRFIGGFN